MDITDQLIIDSKKNPMIEICGFIGYDGKNFLYKRMFNHSPQPDEFFSISPLDYLKFKRAFIFIAVFHSHIKSGCEPTEFDLVNSTNCALPFLIYSTTENKFHLHVPENSEANSSLIEEFKKLV